MRASVLALVDGTSSPAAIELVTSDAGQSLLGSGLPAFIDPGARVKLALRECRQIDGGGILAVYDVPR